VALGGSAVFDKHLLPTLWTGCVATTLIEGYIVATVGSLGGVHSFTKERATTISTKVLAHHYRARTRAAAALQSS
jgi:hypothetical protein